ncbi:MAG: type-4 uracil-DNA glycosylase [Desulfurococcaceae archaeon]
MSIEEEWIKLEHEVLNCRKCRLHEARRKPVPGEGNKTSTIIFIGEAPGEKEDETGRPFVGPAGKLLTELIESIGYKRENFYITNIVKCRPPNNRDPLDDEIESCLPYLVRQLQLMKPKIIIALGRHAGRVLFDLAGLKWISMSANHGKVYRAKLADLDIKIIPTYHPASALYNPSLRKNLEDDFKNVIKKAIDEELRPVENKKQSRTLFDFLRKS